MDYFDLKKYLCECCERDVSISYKSLRNTIKELDLNSDYECEDDIYTITYKEHTTTLYPVDRIDISTHDNVYSTSIIMRELKNGQHKILAVSRDRASFECDAVCENIEDYNSNATEMEDY